MPKGGKHLKRKLSSDVFKKQHPLSRMLEILGEHYLFYSYSCSIEVYCPLFGTSYPSLDSNSLRSANIAVNAFLSFVDLATR